MDIEFFPAPGENLLRFAGDRVRFTLRTSAKVPQAFLRTNLGRASRLHAEVVQEYQEELIRWKLPPVEGAQSSRPRGLAWRDVPMFWRNGQWEIELTVTEPGYFEAKAYAVDEKGRQIWPAGDNLGISVQPNTYRSGNLIYCAFTRMFGETKAERSTVSPLEPQLSRLEKLGYSVIPASGKFRDLVNEIPHIFDTLGCSILHLLPINPVPTTYARFGRFGSPYACQDLLAVDPALVEFDRRTTGIDQFRELTYAVHERGGRVILDIVINHTGWGSDLQENNPDWFLRQENGVFVSPGAWGTTWEDLVELDHRMPLSWGYLAEVFIEWLRRGVDGFRCDAGYKVPTPAWRYIVARVRHEFPDALFLLEGLGGAWKATEDLLTRGGMQWAYSELFQNYTPAEVAGYLDHTLQQSERVGTLVHYSETHDNDRLAAKGRNWSLVRNQLCALASHNGAFGFTCGVEWLATEKVNVHDSRGLAWGSTDNIVPELSSLNRLLAAHPCFFDGAKVRRLSSSDSPILALERISADEQDRVVVLVNLSDKKPATLFLAKEDFFPAKQVVWDLLTRTEYSPRNRDANLEFLLAPAQSLCLADQQEPNGISGELYRKRRAQYGWIIGVLSHSLEPEEFGPHSWLELAEWVEKDPRRFLGAIQYLSRALAARNLLSAIASAAAEAKLPQVIVWNLTDRRRITPVPPNHWILVEDSSRFRVTLSWGDKREHQESVPTAEKHIAAFRPVDIFEQARSGSGSLQLERYGVPEREAAGKVLFLSPEASCPRQLPMPLHPKGSHLNAPTVLLTNATGGMARMCVDLGAVKSKYDCVLGANLHPAVPVDRHIFVKRIRVWTNAARYITPLNAENLQAFSAGPPARWEFAAISGDGSTARIELTADMLPGQNTTLFQFRLLESSRSVGDVCLTVRFDIEDRNFHTETHQNGGADFHFKSNCHPLPGKPGFEFRPASDRILHIEASTGEYFSAPEWSRDLPHPLEETRGQVSAGDAFSPGWFDVPLKPGASALVVVSSEPGSRVEDVPEHFEEKRRANNELAIRAAGFPEADTFGQQLTLAAQAFVVRREKQKTIIAGYPWFLDWGRDSLICARGLLAAGLHDEVRQLLITYGRMERNGTLPNTIHGEDTSNRSTSDAPLWYGVVCQELARETGPEIYDLPVDDSGRRIRDVLRNIAVGYREGTPNGIRLDPGSALIWSPPHYTWMDTNYPAGTPREGYPIEIQALWIQLLRQLHTLGAPVHKEPWDALAATAAQHLQLYWLEQKGYLADTLIATSGTEALKATPDDALRSNCLFPLLFGLVQKEKARSCLEAVARHLVIPGALRSLAPLPLKQPLPIHGPDWRLLNDPHNPYCGRYEGDEDTQRKPAYHNGTAWTWTFPGFCEALARVWEFSPEATATARAYLGSMALLLKEGCIGHLPEVLDGDAPHQQRGCDAQAWGITEALRVWKLLNKPS